MTWKFGEAQKRFNEVVNLALTEGLQSITRRKDTVVLLSAERYAELTRKKVDFKDFLLQGVGLDELDLTRDQTPMRDVES